MKLNILLKRFTSLVELRYDIFKEEISYLILLLLNIIIFTLIGFSTFLVLHWFVCKLFLEVFVYYTGNIILAVLLLILLNVVLLAQVVYFIQKKYHKIQVVAKQIFG